jgi:glycosyltransferase involved in cell wall biosynthesis
MMHMISVIIPTYQHAQTLGACLESMLSQTNRPSEIIVVDDGSTDQTRAVLEPYLDRIRVMHQKNQGAPVARNNGFLASTGSRVMFCDADVVMEPDMLETLSQTLDSHPNAAYAYAGFWWGGKKFSSFPFDPERLKKMNYIHTSALIRRETFPLFDPSLKRFQDWDLWLTMLEAHDTGIHVPRCLYRVMLPRRSVGISLWVPTFLYRVPWNRLGWRPSFIKQYEEAMNIVLKKHRLV